MRNHVQRRVTTISVVVILCLVSSLVAPVVLLISLSIDALKANRLAITRCLLFYLVFLWAETLGVLAAGCIWLVTAGGLVLPASQYLRVHYALQRWWSDLIFKAALRIFSMKVAIDASSAPIAPNGRQILVVRHSSTADTVLAAHLMANPFKFHYRYALKSELRLDPCLDIVGSRLPNVFLERNAHRTDQQLQAIVDVCKGMGANDGFLIFPEGTRYSRAKYERILSKLPETTLGQSRPELLELARNFSSVLPPKVNGFRVALEAVGPSEVVVLGHTGFEGAATFADFIGGELIGKTIHVKVWRQSSASVTVDPDQWLFEQWAELDSWIQSKRTNND